MPRCTAIRSAERHIPIRIAQHPFLGEGFDVGSNIRNVVLPQLLGTEVSTPSPAPTSFQNEYQIVVRAKPPMLTEPEPAEKKKIIHEKRFLLCLEDLSHQVQEYKGGHLCLEICHINRWLLYCKE